MIRTLTALRTLALTTLMLLSVCTLPYYAHAQASPVASADLRASIQSALLSDPRTSGLSQTEINGIVDVLTQEAQNKGLTPQDIMWLPQNTGESFQNGTVDFADIDTCGSSLLCDFNEAFGFVGGDLTIPFILGVASMGLIWIVAEMLHRHRKGILPATKTPPSA